MLVFECDVTESEIIDPDKITDIVSSRSYLGGNSIERLKHRLFNEPELRKYFIPVDFRAYGLGLISYISPGTIIPEHDHDEAVFRLIIDGEMRLNGLPFSKGDWLIVPAHFKYTVETELGYTVFSKYHENCQDCQWGQLSKMPLGRM